MKNVLIATIALFISITAVAQQSKEVDAVLKKIDRSDLTVADPKKAAKAAVWIDRATTMLEAATIYTNKLIANLPVAQMTAANMLGNPKDIEQVKVNGVALDKYIYETFDLYVTPEGMVGFWETTKEIRPGALFDAATALETAKKLNAKDFTGAGRGVQTADKLINELSFNGRNIYMLGKFSPAAKLFDAAFKVSELKGVSDSISLYYAAICYVDGGDYKTALTRLEQLLSLGSNQDGMTLCYIAACTEKLGDLNKAIEVYEKAFSLFPKNSAIMGGLINVYMAADKNPDKLIDLIKHAQKLDEKNVSLYMVESQIWEKIGNRQAGIAAIEKALTIDPKSFDAHYNHAITNLLESDAVVERANKLDINDTKNYDAMMEQVKVMRLKAIEMLEKALTIDPSSSDVSELLLQIYFVCRDYEGVQAKYDKFKAAQAQPQQ